MPVWIIRVLGILPIIPDDLIKSGYKYLFYGLQFSVGMCIIFAGYGMKHYLLKFKWINYPITWTSFTKFRFWRRYKAPPKFLRMRVNL